MGTEPVLVHDGLAVYQRGDGSPVLLMPYPHASGGGPMVGGSLATLLVDNGYQVTTFDPPGQYRSTRPSRVGLDEMVDCAVEALDSMGLTSPVPVLGHSMSALCAFFVTLARPGRVSRLVLVGTPPGSGAALVRYRAMPFHWRPWHPDLWRMVVWGLLLATGHGSLATHKKLDALSNRANFVDPDLAPRVVVEPGDDRRAPPPRDRWWLAVRRVRLVPLARELPRPTLLIVGRHDPQTPLAVSKALHDRIPDSRLCVFERSGHAPFVEEPERFVRVLDGFVLGA